MIKKRQPQKQAMWKPVLRKGVWKPIPSKINKSISKKIPISNQASTDWKDRWWSSDILAGSIAWIKSKSKSYPISRLKKRK
jgi:hypothetical protein